MKKIIFVFSIILYGVMGVLCNPNVANATYLQDENSNLNCNAYLDYGDGVFDIDEEVIFKVMKNNSNVSSVHHEFNNCTYIIHEDSDVYIMYQIIDFQSDFSLKINFQYSEQYFELELYGVILGNNVYVNSSLEDLNNIYIQNESINNVSTYSLWNDDFTINGSLFWKDSSGVEHPLRGVKVDVERKKMNLIVDVLTTYTDDEGNYCVIYPKRYDFLNSQIKLHIYPGNDYISIFDSNNNAYIYENSFNIHNLDIEDDYTFDPIVFDVDTHGDFAKACQIGQATITMNEYAVEMSGESIPHCNIVYPHNNQEKENKCYYNFPNKTIYITNYKDEEDDYLKAYESWDVVMHEYGHHIQNCFGLNASPGGGHSFGGNCYSTFINKKGTNYVEAKEKGCKLAWGESVATFISQLAQDYYKEDLIGVNYIADFEYRSQGVSGENLLDVDGKGEDNEDSILYILLRIYFSNETRFFSDISHQQLWDIIIDEEIQTLSDFINIIYELLDTMDASLKEYIILGEILCYGEVSNYLNTSKFNNNCFLWNYDYLDICLKKNGILVSDNDKYKYNYSELILCDEDFNEIFIKEVNACNYTLTKEEYDEIVAAKGNVYYVGVYCYQRCTDGINTFNTGGYLTNILRFTKERDVIELSGNEVYYEHTNYYFCAEPVTYEVSSSSSCIALLQTFSLSPADSYLEIYRLNENNEETFITDIDDDGCGLNSFIYFSFEKDVKYLIKIIISNNIKCDLKFTITITNDFYDTFSDIENIAIYNTKVINVNFQNKDTKIYTLFLTTGTYNITMNPDIDIILVNQNEIVECIKGYETSITITVTGTYQSYYLVVDSNGLNNASIVISKL